MFSFPDSPPHNSKTSSAAGQRIISLQFRDIQGKSGVHRHTLNYNLQAALFIKTEVHYSQNCDYFFLLFYYNIYIKTLCLNVFLCHN